MATSSARMMVRVSSHPAASINIVVFVGMCTSATPSRGCPLMSKPSVYTHSSGEKWGVQGNGTGGVSDDVAVGTECVFLIIRSVRVSSRGEGLREDVGVPPGVSGASLSP